MLSIPLSLHDNTQNTQTSANGKHRTSVRWWCERERKYRVQFRTNLLLISSESVRNGNFRQENSPYAFLLLAVAVAGSNAVCKIRNRTALRQLVHSKLHVEFMKKSFPVSNAMDPLALHFFKQRIKLILHANRFLIAAQLC